jgi:epoxyqueuosine reductase
MFPSGAIKQHALDLGFDLVGVGPPSAVQDLAFLRQWVKNGHGGEMRYLADPRREDLRRVMPSVQSVICVGLIYNTEFPYSTDAGSHNQQEGKLTGRRASPREPGSRAWISRYAWGSDYHNVMRGKLEKLRIAIESLAEGVETRVYVDTGPILERAFARLSGIGWMGKNTCLINEQKGSWFFLGVVLSSLELEFDLPAPDRCGSCTRCLEACPTGALVQPYVMDASRCIAYLNIELKGAIPEEFRAAMGSNVFGCDICQDVCPWNNRPSPAREDMLRDDAAPGGRQCTEPQQRHTAATRLAEFQPMQIAINASEQGTERARGNQPVPPSPSEAEFSLCHPAIQDLALISEEGFRLLFARSPIKRAKYRGWFRNLCVAMGNSGDPKFILWLESAADYPDPIVREHAGWALRKLQGGP